MRIKYPTIQTRSGKQFVLGQKGVREITDYIGIRGYKIIKLKIKLN